MAGGARTTASSARARPCRPGRPDRPGTPRDGPGGPPRRRSRHRTSGRRTGRGRTGRRPGSPSGSPRPSPPACPPGSVGRRARGGGPRGRAGRARGGRPGRAPITWPVPSWITNSGGRSPRGWTVTTLRHRPSVGSSPRSSRARAASRSGVGASSSADTGRSMPRSRLELDDEAHGAQRVATEVEEVVVRVDRSGLEIEHLGERLDERADERGTGSTGCADGVVGSVKRSGRAARSTLPPGSRGRSSTMATRSGTIAAGSRSPSARRSSRPAGET